MKVQTLISAMNQFDERLLNEMNIQTDAILINQTDKLSEKNFVYKGKNIKMLSFNERGIGLSRNNALMRAEADICVFADEDLSYVDGYETIILKEFEENPKADIILFNVPSKNVERPTYMIPKKSRVRWFNSQRYGAVKIVAKTEKVKRANVYFSLLFGGGAKYNAGEDSLFIAECLKKGLKIYASPEVIGHVSQEDSAWFEGFNEKYFHDKGVFFSALSRKTSWILCLQFILRKKKMFKGKISPIKAFLLMIKGTGVLYKGS